MVLLAGTVRAKASQTNLRVRCLSVADFYLLYSRSREHGLRQLGVGHPGKYKGSIMKIAMTSVVLLGLSALLSVSCSADNDSSRVLPPVDSAGDSSKTSEATKPQATEIDQHLGASGEAVAQLVSTEVSRQLEADYQVAIKKAANENQLKNLARVDAAVDFQALFDNIRNTMPPGRGLLLREYVTAAERVADVAERKRLLERLGSPELNNVR